MVPGIVHVLGNGTARHCKCLKIRISVQENPFEQFPYITEARCISCALQFEQQANEPAYEREHKVKGY